MQPHPTSSCRKYSGVRGSAPGLPLAPRHRMGSGQFRLQTGTKREYTAPMFVELSAISNFTFLTGGSHPEEYIEQAASAGMPALAIADANSVAGIVRAHVRAREVARAVRLRRQADADPIGPPCPDHLPRPASAPIYARAAADPGGADRAVGRLRRHRPAARPRRLGRGCAGCSPKGRRRAPKGRCELGLDDLIGMGRRDGAAAAPADTGRAGAGRRGRMAAGGAAAGAPLPRPGARC